MSWSSEMCTDIRLVKIADHQVSARTLDFAFELGSQVEVVPRGNSGSSVPTETSVPALKWTNELGFVGMNAFGFEWGLADGLNEAGLSIGTLWLPETKIPTTAPASGEKPAMDFINIARWILGTCRTVADAKTALESVQIWNPSLGQMWPKDRPMPAQAKPLEAYSITEHISMHDAQGKSLVVEFLDGQMHFHDNPIGVMTNSPTYDWHLTNLRNYIELTNVEKTPVNLMGMEVTPTGNGTGLMGMPGDVTPPSRFVRATMLTMVADKAKDARDAINQAFHSLDLVSVPRFVAASGDYTQWYVARDHDNPTYYVRDYDSWTTDVHVLADLKVNEPGPQRQIPLPSR
jgi:choloylglycine hydrolase